MADVNNKIIVSVEDNATQPLERIGSGIDGLHSSQTKVTQSTKSLTKETHALNDGLLKNNGLMGLLSAATGGLAMDFKDASEAIEGAGVELKGLRGAIIATGIGALAIAVLELVTNWDKWIGAIDGSTAALENLNETQKDVAFDIQVNNNLRDLESSKIAEQIRLLEAQGASEKELRAKRDEYSAVRLKYLDDEIEKQQQLNDANQLAGGGTTGLNEEDRIKALDDFQKGVTRLTQLQVEQNAIINDPKVRAAEAQSLINNKKKEESLRAQKELQNQLAQSLQRMTASAKILEDINSQLRGVMLLDVTSTYGKWKVLEDAFYKNRDAIKSVNVEIQKYNDLKNKTTVSAEQTKEFELNKTRLELYKDNAVKLDILIKKQQEYIDTEGFAVPQRVRTNIELVKMSDNYEELSKSMMLYEKFGGDKTNEDKLIKINALLEAQLAMLNKKSNQEIKDNQTKKVSLDQEAERLESNQQKLLSYSDVYKEYFKKAQDAGLDEETSRFMASGRAIADIKKRMDLELEGKAVVSEREKQDYKEYYENQDRINDYKKQSLGIENDIQLQRAQTSKDVNQMILDAELEQLVLSIDAKKTAHEQYTSDLEILYSDLYGFIGNLQNASFITDRNTKNMLLVAQKGMEIAQVVMSTVRANAKLKMQAIDATKSAAYEKSAAFASAAAYDYAGAINHGIAAANFTAAAASSGSGIVTNWGIAGASIASILATTMTSWNRSDGGSGSGSGGGGGTPQFNIVGQSGNNQLAQSIANKQNQPVNAYVVGSDVTTQQALDRNRITNATFL